MRMRSTKRDPSWRDRCLAFLVCGIGFPFGLTANESPTPTARTTSPQVITQVPLQIRDSRVSLEVMVNGQGPFRFGLDTGASQAAWVTRALVEKLNLPVVEGFRVSDGTGKNSRNSDGVRIDRVTVGDVIFQSDCGARIGRWSEVGR